MLKHNFLLIFRNYKRFKSAFLINLIGLSTGLTCTMLIYLWVNDELKFDKFHEKNDRLFQVLEHEREGSSIKTSSHTAEFLAAALAGEMPEVEYSTVVTPPNFFPSFTVFTDDHHVKAVGKFADKDFFNIFSYGLVQGNPSQVLTGKNNIVISESLAKSLFNSVESCIGKSIRWRLLYLKGEVTIAGVFKDVPSNSSERFDFIMPFDFFKDLVGIQNSKNNWDATPPFLTYLVVKEKADLRLLNSKIQNFLKHKGATSQHRSLFLQLYSRNYLYGHYENDKESGGRIEYVKLFATIAIFILLIACTNFVNLSTAKAIRKVKEAGIKMTLGAQRKTIIHQYLSEALALTSLSVIIAIGLVSLLLPQFNEITGKSLVLHLNTEIILAIIILTLITAFLAGIYPAFYLSGFNPAKVLKGEFRTSLGELWARKGLVVFQFALSLIFIVSVLIVYKQIEFVQAKYLGYDKENVIYFESEGRVSENPETFIAEIKKLRDVTSASSMLGNIVSGRSTGEKQMNFNNAGVNYDMLELLGLEMKEGRTFSRNFPSDTTKVIYNEAAIKALNLKDPVGRIINGKEILGVVKDFHYQSLHEVVKPFFFWLEPRAASTIMVKIRSGAEQQAVSELKSFYKSFNPGFVFSYRFLDQEYQAQYVAEKRVAELSKYAAALAIIISCLGLLGLAAFTTEKRSKEISIRKVLGASELGIALLLSNDFTKMVVLSICIALPMSYFISTYWLENFAYKIELKWWYFLGAALMTLLITWLTIGLQTIKAAKTNPVIGLRSE